MTSRSTQAQPTTRRVRPADRRDEIIDAAAEAFSTRGFAATRLTDIAAAVGISAPALYRHFDNKYDLFAAAVSRLAANMSDAVGAVPVADDPGQELRAVLAAFIDAAVDQRAVGNLYRWEHRVLHVDDREAVRAVRIATHRRVRDLVVRAHADVRRPAADLLTIAALSVGASPSTHRVAMPRRAATELLTDAALVVTRVPLTTHRTQSVAARTGLTPASRRETILSAAIALFSRRGFHEVTVEDIGSAVGLPASGVYRHFASKGAILAAALWRTADRTTAAIESALAQAHTPREAVIALANQYASLCVADPDIMAVYLSGTGAIGDEELRSLRRQQRLNVDEWATWVIRTRPTLTMSAARYLVHACLNVASDLATTHPSAGADTIGRISGCVLTGDPD